MDISELKVEKKDGSQEEFKDSKIVGGIVMSGGGAEEAKNIASKVVEWALENNEGGVVKTSDIRVKVLELLKEANPEAADAFEAYKRG